MKVKVFSCQNKRTFEEEINDFLKTIPTLKDIKFSSSDQYFDAIIIYDDETKATV